jgi:hypothetical protein
MVYALRPRLRGRLTLNGLTFFRKPESFGGQGSHLAYRYLCRQGHFAWVHRPLSVRLRPASERPPTTPPQEGVPSFGGRLKSPAELSVPNRLTSELLRFL